MHRQCVLAPSGHPTRCQRHLASRLPALPRGGCLGRRVRLRRRIPDDRPARGAAPRRARQHGPARREDRLPPGREGRPALPGRPHRSEPRRSVGHDGTQLRHQRRRLVPPDPDERRPRPPAPDGDVQLPGERPDARRHRRRHRVARRPRRERPQRPPRRPVAPASSTDRHGGARRDRCAAGRDGHHQRELLARRSRGQASRLTTTCGCR